MAANYVVAFNEMLEKHPLEFAAFAADHDAYKTKGDIAKSKFDLSGKVVMDIIIRTQNLLCRKMENTNRGKFSSALADKFMSAVRSKYPLIDLVGVSVS